MGSIYPTVSEICVPQSLDPICAKFDKFLAHGQAHMRQMGKWPWQSTTTGLDNSTKLQMEKIHQEVTEIWVPQIWQPPARLPTRPPARTVTTIPLQPGGLRDKNGYDCEKFGIFGATFLTRLSLWNQIFVWVHVSIPGFASSLKVETYIN